MKFLLPFLLFCCNLFAQTNPNHVWVNGYTRSDGTHVQGHYRTQANNTNTDNFSTIGNTNPYTGQAGWVTPDGGRPNTYSQSTYNSSTTSTSNFYNSNSSNRYRSNTDYSTNSNYNTSNNQVTISREFYNDLINDNERLRQKVYELEKQWEEEWAMREAVLEFIKKNPNVANSSYGNENNPGENDIEKSSYDEPIQVETNFTELDTAAIAIDNLPENRYDSQYKNNENSSGGGIVIFIFIVAIILMFLFGGSR